MHKDTLALEREMKTIVHTTTRLRRTLYDRNLMPCNIVMVPRGTRGTTTKKALALEHATGAGKATGTFQVRFLYRWRDSLGHRHYTVELAVTREQVTFDNSA